MLHSLLHVTMLCTFAVALQSLIKYISELGIPGAILIFLPGWNIIFALGRHLSQHPVIGESETVITGMICTVRYVVLNKKEGVEGTNSH